MRRTPRAQPSCRVISRPFSSHQCSIARRWARLLKGIPLFEQVAPLKEILEPAIGAAPPEYLIHRLLFIREPLPDELKYELTAKVKIVFVRNLNEH